LSNMVTNAIRSLRLHKNDRKGASMAAIKTYVHENYNVRQDSDTYLKAALKRGLESRELGKVTGLGLGGSFKITADKSPKKR